MLRHIGWNLALGCLLAVGVRGQFATASHAADAVYTEIVPDEALTEWLVLGPIPAVEKDGKRDNDAVRKSGLNEDLLKDAQGEAKVEPKVGHEVEARDANVAWKLHTSDSNIVDFLKALEEKNYVVGYAAATIESPKDETKLVGLGSDDGVRVWLNGEVVHDSAAPRGVNVDQDIFPLKLKKGPNRLLVKVVNEEGGWGFTLRFLSKVQQGKQLFMAAFSGNLDAVRALVAAGIDPATKSDEGFTAAQLAKLRGHEGVVEFLVSKGSPQPELFDGMGLVKARLKALASDELPGIAVLVSRDGKVVLSESYGMADLANDVPITTQTKFRIGSVTKQFTAAAILKLQEDGKLSVEDKLSKYIEDFPRGDEVTIHHLLTHTSGIKSYTSKPDFFSTAALGASVKEMVESIKKDETYDFDPGTQLSYNNSGYFLLGAIIEKVSGKTYDEYLRETFFEPLGMNDTGVHTAQAVLKHEATGYETVGNKTRKSLNWDMSKAGGAGALYSTVDDLMKWNEAVFGGKVLSEESLKAAFTPVKLKNGDAPQMSYGYGWMFGDYRGQKRIYHGGGLHGWCCELVRYPEKNVTVVVLHNSLPPVTGFTPGEVAESAADGLMWQELKPRPRYEVDESLDPKSFAKFVGRYDYMGGVMDIALDGDQLTAQLTGQPRFPIFAYGAKQFFWKIVDAQIEFMTNDKDEVTGARHTQGGASFMAKRLGEEKEVKVDAETLDKYAGKYEYAGLGVLTVRRDGDQLKAQMTGQPEFELFAKSPNTFFWKVVVAEIEFDTGDDGKVTGGTHRQGGATIKVKKIE